jgi:hypothetical protein
LEKLPVDMFPVRDEGRPKWENNRGMFRNNNNLLKMGLPVSLEVIISIIKSSERLLLLLLLLPILILAIMMKRMKKPIAFGPPLMNVWNKNATKRDAS